MEFGKNENIEEVNTPFGAIHIVFGFNEPMLVAKEIATVLGFKDPKGALKYHLSNGDKAYADINVGGRTRNTAIITRNGMYKLAMKTTLPTAKQFCDWVANVLVQIADHGSYTIGDSPQDLILDLLGLCIQTLIFCYGFKISGIYYIYEVYQEVNMYAPNI